MKTKLLVTALALGFIGCAENAAEKQNETVPTEENVSTIQNVEQSIKGNWLNESFYKKFMASKSMEQSINIESAELIFFPSNETSEYTHIFNFHEGMGDVKMTKKADGFYVMDYMSNAEVKVEFLAEDKIRIKDVVYIRVDHGSELNTALSEQYFLAGQYTIDGVTIELFKDGTIKNWEKFQKYEAKVDYVEESGNDILTLNDKLGVIYKFENNDLLIFEKKCKTMEDEVCYETQPGKLLYHLKRIN